MKALLDPSVLILAVVLVLIAVRQVGRVRLPIWIIMLSGAAAALASGRIAPLDALRAVDLDVMLFLFGMFVLGRAMEESGFLLTLSHRLFRKARSTSALVLLVLYGMGMLSAVLMNDTLAVIGTPLILYFAAKHGISPTMLLLALSFAVTTGSVLSPIGNPQNLLIALHTGMGNPIATFLLYLGVPSLVNLFLAFLVLRLLYPKEFHDQPLLHEEEPLKDPGLAALCRISLWIVILCIAAKTVIVSFGIPVDFRLTYIALAAAVPILTASPRRFRILRRMDWPTLVFFASLFILMRAVWNSGAIQSILGGRTFASVPSILGLSVLLSQLVSNVPFTALFLPLLAPTGASAATVMALAAGSTIAGNLLLLGAASNIIVVQAAEERGGTLGFLDFARAGIPLTACNVLVYWGWLSLLG